MAGAPTPSDKTTPADDQCHITFSRISGFQRSMAQPGFNTSVKASPGDLLSHFEIGLMGTVAARKQHFVAPVNFMWVALGDDNYIM
jgi:hypothetical protein